jgi:hypothetical protein
VDKRFLNKVVDQIVRETRIDHDEKRVYNTFSPSYHMIDSLLFLFSFPLLSSDSNFSKHCKNVYGLNDDEVSYVWNEYKKIIKNMLPY